MAERFTKATEEAKVWCARCGRPTMHYVFDGRRGGCQACAAKQEARPKAEPAAQQETLF